MLVPTLHLHLENLLRFIKDRSSSQNFEITGIMQPNTNFRMQLRDSITNLLQQLKPNGEPNEFQEMPIVEFEGRPEQVSISCT